MLRMNDQDTFDAAASTITQAPHLVLVGDKALLAGIALTPKMTPVTDARRQAIAAVMAAVLVAGAL